MITCKLETIGPDLATEYLLQTNDLNRYLSDAHVDELLGKQARGEWVTNGDTIRFDTDKHLRDGQHRLKMVQLSGIPIKVIVVRGLDPAAFLTMDVGKKRTLEDLYNIEKRRLPTLLAPTSALIWRYLAGDLLKAMGSHDEVKAMLDKHPDIVKSCVFYTKLPLQRGMAPIHKEATIAAHYLFSRVDPQKADAFITVYATGLDAEIGNPAFTARTCIMNISRGTRPPTSLQTFRLLATSFNNFLDGKQNKYVQVLKRSKIHEHFEIKNFPEKLFIKRTMPGEYFKQYKMKFDAEQHPEEDET